MTLTLWLDALSEIVIWHEYGLCLRVVPELTNPN